MTSCQCCISGKAVFVCTYPILPLTLPTVHCLANILFKQVKVSTLSTLQSGHLLPLKLKPNTCPRREPNSSNSSALQRQGLGRLCPQAAERPEPEDPHSHSTVFVSIKIKQEIKVHEKKTAIFNQQRVVYKFHCDLMCDVSYVGYTPRHLHQCMAEDTKQSSSIVKHFINEHCIVRKDLTRHFSVPKKCTS